MTVRHSRTAGPPPTTTTTWRLFFGIPTPEYLQRCLQDLQTDFRGDWRPVNPTQFHVTLAFLGEIPEDKIPSLVEAGRAAARDTPTFAARFCGLTAFPDLRRPRVGVALIDSEPLNILADRLKAALSQHNLTGDSRPFHAHLTLVRSRGGEVETPDKKLSRSWDITAFHLYRSILRPEGPRHLILASFPLNFPPPD